MLRKNNFRVLFRLFKVHLTYSEMSRLNWKKKIKWILKAIRGFCMRGNQIHRILTGFYYYWWYASCYKQTVRIVVSRRAAGVSHSRGRWDCCDDFSHKHTRSPFVNIYNSNSNTIICSRQNAFDFAPKRIVKKNVVPVRGGGPTFTIGGGRGNTFENRGNFFFFFIR